MNINYRVATNDDVESLSELDNQSADTQLTEYRKVAVKLFDVDDYFNGGGCFWVAEDRNKIIGMVGARVIDEKVIKVKALRVHPEYRNKGIAVVLMNLLEKFCIEKGAREIILGVDQYSLPAIKLYEKLGFKKYEEKRFEEGNVAFYFKKEIN